MQKKSWIHPILFQLWKKTYASICGFEIEHVKFSNLIRHKATNNNKQLLNSNFLTSCEKRLNFDPLDRRDCALQIGASVSRISLLVLTF